MLVVVRHGVQYVLLSVVDSVHDLLVIGLLTQLPGAPAADRAFTSLTASPISPRGPLVAMDPFQAKLVAAATGATLTALTSALIPFS